MKYWENPIKCGLTLEQVNETLKQNKYCYAKIPETDDIYFYNKRRKQYFMLSNNEEIDTVDYIQDKHLRNWTLVSISDEALTVLEERALI